MHSLLISNIKGIHSLAIMNTCYLLTGDIIKAIIIFLVTICDFVKKTLI